MNIKEINILTTDSFSTKQKQKAFDITDRKIIWYPQSQYVSTYVSFSPDNFFPYFWQLETGLVLYSIIRNQNAFQTSYEIKIADVIIKTKWYDALNVFKAIVFFFFNLWKSNDDISI